jgi:hypothetical protein
VGKIMGIVKMMKMGMAMRDITKNNTDITL